MFSSLYTRKQIEKIFDKSHHDLQLSLPRAGQKLYINTPGGQFSIEIYEKVRKLGGGWIYKLSMYTREEFNATIRSQAK